MSTPGHVSHQAVGVEMRGGEELRPVRRKRLLAELVDLDGHAVDLFGVRGGDAGVASAVGRYRLCYRVGYSVEDLWRSVFGPRGGKRGGKRGADAGPSW